MRCIEYHALNYGAALDVDEVGIADDGVAAGYRLPFAVAGEEFEILLDFACVEQEDVVEEVDLVCFAGRGVL